MRHIGITLEAENEGFTWKLVIPDRMGEIGIEWLCFRVFLWWGDKEDDK